jgi:hypothetical protein
MSMTGGPGRPSECPQLQAQAPTSRIDEVQVFQNSVSRGSVRFCPTATCERVYLIWQRSSVPVTLLSTCNMCFALEEPLESSASR